MNKHLFLTTAVGLLLGTSALAQSPSSTTTTTTTPPAAQSQTTSPSGTTSPAPSSNAPSQVQSTTPSPAGPAGTTAPSQAQTTTPSSGAAPAASQAQTTNPAPSNNQAQQAPASSNTNTTAQQPSQSAPQTNTAQSSTTNVNASININDQQRTRVTQSIARLNVQPLTNINFSVSVGTVIPRDVQLQTLPAEVVEIVPQYRGYSFFVVRDEIVIVEPSTYKIVTVLPRSGASTAAAPAPSQNRVTFTDKDREVVRKHTRARTEQHTTTGSSAKVIIRRGERLPDTVEMEEFPETVYRESPALKEYRYIHRENRTYLVNPSDRMVIEEID